MTGPYARYDYAWQTPGWTSQDPVVNYAVDGYIDPGLPEDVTQVKVWDTFLEGFSGRSLDGVVQFRVDQILRHETTGQQVMPGVFRRRFRKDGFAYYLPATDDPQLTPNGFKYQCRLTVRGVTQEFEFLLPSSLATEDGVRLTSLIPAP